MARVRGATRGEVLRAAQKDASYLEALEGKVRSSNIARFPDPLAFRSLFGQPGLDLACFSLQSPL